MYDTCAQIYLYIVHSTAMTSYLENVCGDMHNHKFVVLYIVCSVVY